MSAIAYLQQKYATMPEPELRLSVLRIVRNYRGAGSRQERDETYSALLVVGQECSRRGLTGLLKEALDQVNAEMARREATHD